MTPNRPSSPPTPSARRPTAPQQRVLERIAAQRARLRARSAQRHQLQTEAASAQGVSPDAPMLQRLAMFAKLHPVAVRPWWPGHGAWCAGREWFCPSSCSCAGDKPRLFRQARFLSARAVRATIAGPS